MATTKGMKFPNRKRRSYDRLELFNKKYTLVESGCWQWRASKNRNGYGNFGYKNKTQLAHRVSYQIFIGDIEQDMDILHTCDNPSCVNPFHLFKGTHFDNMRDMVNKGRRKSTKGEAAPSSKLTAVQVRYIRRYAHKKHWRFFTEKFNICQSSFYGIKNGVSWKS